MGPCPLQTRCLMKIQVVCHPAHQPFSTWCRWKAYWGVWSCSIIHLLCRFPPPGSLIFFQLGKACVVQGERVAPWEPLFFSIFEREAAEEAEEGFLDLLLCSEQRTARHWSRKVTRYKASLLTARGRLSPWGRSSAGRSAGGVPRRSLCWALPAHSRQGGAVCRPG